MIIFDLFDSIKSFVSNFSFLEILDIFWFLFLIEIPRYYLLDLCVLGSMLIRRKQIYRKESIARAKLFLESPFVSVIVPGKNEGKHIYKLSVTLREQTYKNIEIVVVDDGSDDNTAIICNSLCKNGFIDRFYSVNERGGKASAANLALFNNKAKYIVHLDADSSLDRNAIEELLLPFYINDNVGAVGGCVKVRNADDSLCAALQSFEYLETIMVGRTVTSELKIYRTISGAFGAFRKDVLDQVGNWDTGPGLDGDITQKIRKSGYNVVFTRKAICLTNVPTSFYKLYNQRLRWSKSLIRFRLRKHINVLDTRSANFSISNFISNIENIIFNFVFDMLWLVYIINLLAGNYTNILELLILKFIIMIPLGVLSYLMIIALTERKKEEMTLLILVPLQMIYSGYFLRITRIIGSFKEIFFFSSYKDAWNPNKTSRFARYDGM